MDRNVPLLEVTGLNVDFPGPRRRGTKRQALHAVKDVEFSIARGETLGLVGESGSGKSTVARAILQLLKPASGEVKLNGEELTTLKRRALRDARKGAQMVFQDPYSSLDPSMLIGDSVSEPLRVHTRLRSRQRDARVTELLDLVGLSAHHIERYPYEFSGGQRQRVAIARALALNPSLMICDEAVSALDVSTQNQIIVLLERLREKFDVAYLFISHDLAVVRHISDRVAVMYFGRIVEIGDVTTIFERPAHPYTAALLDAVPLPDPRAQRGRTKARISGEIPDLAAPPQGCSFASRCQFATDICREVVPEFRDVHGTAVACHHPLQG